MSLHKAIFIDKDGTLIDNIPFNTDPALISLKEGAIEGLKLLSDAGYLLIVVSNQGGVAYGYFEEKELERVKLKINYLLGDENIYLDGFYYCPHHPNGAVKKYAIDCNCRKPKPGMLLKAKSDFNIDLGRSWMIGDILHDIEAGNRAGCKTILIGNENETEWNINKDRIPLYTACDIKQAADFIITRPGTT
jgi:D,D-heptose 1,7-bisphosphate phosphatase